MNNLMMEDRFMMNFDYLQCFISETMSATTKKEDQQEYIIFEDRHNKIIALDTFESEQTTTVGLYRVEGSQFELLVSLTLNITDCTIVSYKKVPQGMSFLEVMSTIETFMKILHSNPKNKELLQHHHNKALALLAR